MKNTVEYLGHYGSDETIALSAWTSTSRELTPEKRERIPTLVRRLWWDGHETPAEKGILHFLITSDIATHIQLLKHRMASINSESARYKELKEDRSLIPEDWPDTSDPSFHESLKDRLQEFSDRSNNLYHTCLAELTPKLGRKRAKESSRYFKLYNSQITCDFMINMRSFANFIKLRNSEHAQVEIRELAQQMESIVDSIPGNPFQHIMAAIRSKNAVITKIQELGLEQTQKLLGIE